MTSDRILLLEDRPTDAFVIRSAIESAGYAVTSTGNEADYVAALKDNHYCAIVADHSLPGAPSERAIELANMWQPGVPVVCLSGAINEQDGAVIYEHGAVDYISKDQLWRLPFALKRATGGALPFKGADGADQDSLMILIEAIQSLSVARSLDEIAATIRTAARALVKADGATFIIKERDLCYYADEEAISPLWKGLRFPLDQCMSGWVMKNRIQQAVPDIYQDDRIPHDAYRKTFVKSLVMTPVRKSDPIAAIGTYWANHYSATKSDMQMLQMLADTTSVAIANVSLFDELETRVCERTKQLEDSVDELQTFAYSVAHDLKSPLFGLHQIAQLLLGQEQLDLNECRTILETISDDALRMSDMTQALLKLYTMSLQELNCQPCDLSASASRILAALAQQAPARKVDITVAPNLVAAGDPALFDSVLENLIDNAWKYTARVEEANIEIGKLAPGAAGPEAKAKSEADADTSATADFTTFFVRDNGAGFDMKYSGKLFRPFQRLHSPSDFVGMGIGLATVNRIVKRYNGRVWAESQKGKGTTFFFTLPNQLAPQ